MHRSAHVIHYPSACLYRPTHPPIHPSTHPPPPTQARTCSRAGRRRWTPAGRRAPAPSCWPPRTSPAPRRAAPPVRRPRVTAIRLPGGQTSTKRGPRGAVARAKISTKRGSRGAVARSRHPCTAADGPRARGSRTCVFRERNGEKKRTINRRKFGDLYSYIYRYI